VAAGVDVVTFSGDKLLGGPQGGIILGKKAIIDRIKQNPMNRALRIDKFTLAALETVLRLYFDEDKARTTIPTLAMLTMDYATIRRRANRLRQRLRKGVEPTWQVATVNTVSRVGGGALPEQGLASRAVTVQPGDRSVNSLEQQLRKAALPVIGRIEDDRLVLDLRTVADDEVALLADTLLAVFKENPA
jgi:L-seryl-tRNA(Ser) seleniumtransferase